MDNKQIKEINDLPINIKNLMRKIDLQIKLSLTKIEKCIITRSNYESPNFPHSNTNVHSYFGFCFHLSNGKTFLLWEFKSKRGQVIMACLEGDDYVVSGNLLNNGRELFSKFNLESFISSLIIVK